MYLLVGELKKLKRRELTLSGKYEKEKELERKINKRLESAPNIINEYYYSLIGSGKSYDTAYRYINYILSFINMNWLYLFIKIIII